MTQFSLSVNAFYISAVIASLHSSTLARISRHQVQVTSSLVGLGKAKGERHFCIMEHTERKGDNEIMEIMRQIKGKCIRNY